MGEKKSLKDAMDDVTKNQKMVTDTDIDLESTETFQNLPQAVKDAIRSGTAVDTELSEIDAALKTKEENGIDALNAIRAEKNLAPVDAAQLKEDIVDDTKENSLTDTSLEDEIERQMAVINGENYDDPDENTDDAAEEKRLRYFEKMMEESTTISFNGIKDGRTPSDDAAPLNFKIKRNNDYEETIKTVLADNAINFKVNKKNALKSALLRDFVNRHPHVTTPLLNSGFHVTISGASIPEIIQMNTMKAKSNYELTMKKLGFISKHVVDSSIGKKLTATQLAKSVFYKDQETLWFNFILGTLPETFEYPLNCSNTHCNNVMKVKITTPELILNAADFDDITKYILYENTDITDVLNYSKVSKEKKVVLSDSKVRISIINPTIFDSIMLTSKIEDSKIKMDTYSEIAGYLLFVKNISLIDDKGEYTTFDTLDEILDILSTLSSDDLSELDDYIEEYSLHNMVKYGIRSYTCPKCGKVHPETMFDLSSMLFIVCQMELNKSKLAKIRRKKELQQK